MSELDELRNEVDAADDAILAALRRRFDVTDRIRALKAREGLPRVDAEREREILARVAAASNSVEVVFGRDANEDGVLGIEEGELCVGWDCGEWYWRDRRANTTCRVVGTTQRLDVTLYLTRDREAKSLASSVFPSVVSPTCFNPDWNLARVVSRGAEPVRVDSKVSIDALKLRIR